MLHSSNVVPIDPGVVPNPRDSAKCGNLWMIAATVICETMAGGGGAIPYMLVVSPEGEVEALSPEHPEYAPRILGRNYACMLASATPVTRVAVMLRDAALHAAGRSA